jgi:hypothetical protein
MRVKVGKLGPETNDHVPICPPNPTPPFVAVKLVQVVLEKQFPNT